MRSREDTPSGRRALSPALSWLVVALGATACGYAMATMWEWLM